MPLADIPAVNTVPFRTLVYRYFFFGWLFQDIDRCGADVFLRAAVLRHNHRQASWLPVYMRRWLCCAALVGGLAMLLEKLPVAPVCTCCLYAAAGLCAAVAVATATAWMGLRLQPA